MRNRPAALIGIAVVWLALIALGTWQVQRAWEKQALLAAQARARDEPPQTSAACPATDAALRPARVSGTFVTSDQILLDNRIRNGRAGYDVITPLRLGSGELLLVNRGWVAAGATRAQAPEAPAPAGRVTLEGQWRVPEHNPFVPRRAPERVGDFWRSARIDPTVWSTRLGSPVCDLLLLLDADQPHGYLRGWPLMTFGPQRHYGYAAQWYGLALALAGLVFYAWRRW